MLGKTKVKYIQSLGQKKVRDHEGVFMAEGPKIIAELLSAGNARIREVYAVYEWLEEHRHTIKEADAIEVTTGELGKISQLTTPNQVLAVVEKLEMRPVATEKNISLVLDGIQDPGNMGTIIRIADWFGIPQVICSASCADCYNPKVVQATMGSIARVSVQYTELPAWLALQKTVAIYGASLDGNDITTIKKLSEGIIIIGNESKGISREVMEYVGEKITIARRGYAESLNAAVATGIILSHLPR